MLVVRGWDGDVVQCSAVMYRGLYVLRFMYK